jgi:hypothetical protein
VRESGVTLLAYAVLIGLAAYRLFRMGALDTIFDRPREWLYDREGQPWEFLADLVYCPWCIGWWCSGLLSGLVSWHESYGWVSFVLLWCASSTVCGLVKRLDQ